MQANDQSQVRPSIYGPLDVDNYEYRILELLPGTPESGIRCKLIKASHLSPTKYSALSYCSGDSTVTKEITVNEIAIQVTVNLADALSQLRQLGVSRIWADALCINQADEQEKGHQLRYMKHIFARAEQTYAWVGKEGTDNSAAAIYFLQAVFKTSSDIILEEISHNHEAANTKRISLPQLCEQDIGMTRQDISPPVTLLHKEGEDCQRCMLEFHFHSLQAFLDREYWKRRWIIQGCCFSSRKSNVWECDDSLRRETERASLPLTIVQEFRQDYQNAGSLALFKAIARSYRSHSTDPRDTIYALLGICSDGVDLVPIPNYKQSMDVVLGNLTRTLIWRTSCLDVILMIRKSRKPAITRLPSWAPDLTRGSSIPKEAYELSFTRPQFERSMIPMPDEIDGNLLRVQGVIIGTIVDITSSLQSSSTSRRNRNEIGMDPGSRHVLGTSYYHCKNEFRGAILSCLLTNNGLDTKSVVEKLNPEFWTGDRHSMPFSFGFSFISSRRQAWNVLCHFRDGAPLVSNNLLHITITDEHSGSVLSETFHEWIIANGSFVVHGRTLQQWFKERDSRFSVFSYYLRLMEAGKRIVVRIPIPILLVWFMSLFTISLLLLSLGVSFLIAREQIALGSSMLCVGVVMFLTIVSTYNLLYFLSSLPNLLSATLMDEGVLDTKLVAADKGFIGRVFAGAEIGDKICFIAGCTKAVVLREIPSENGVQYSVVGPAMVVALSSGDLERYRGFLQNRSNLGYRDENRYWRQNMRDEERNSLLRGYKESGMLRELQLI